jgi:hypothetical protein
MKLVHQSYFLHVLWIICSNSISFFFFIEKKVTLFPPQIEEELCSVLVQEIHLVQFVLNLKVRTDRI